MLPMILNETTTELTTVDFSEVLTTALNGIQADYVKYVAIALPVGLTIFALGFGIRKALGFFKSVTQ